MPIEILMPALSPTMTEGNLVKWHKSVGDAVAAGDILAEIETDKATMEVEAVDEGTMGKILIAEGAESVAVNTPIAILLGDGEDAAALDTAAAAPPPAPAAAPVQADSSAPTPPPQAAAAPASDEDRFYEKTATQTVREALRDAMAEEMRNDPAVFLIGEEVAEYQGAYKVSQGLLEEFGERRVIDTPSTVAGFAGIGAALAAEMLPHAFDYLDAPVARGAGVDVPMPYAANLETLALPQVDGIVQAARDACYRS